LLSTRVPVADGARVRALAERREWSLSDTVAALLQVALAHPAELPATPPSARPREPAVT